MIGLTFFATLIAFVALLIWLSGLLTRKMRPGVRKVLLRAVMVVGVFPLMVADEIIGKYQFEALCRANGIESADVSKARGKTVKREVGEPRSSKWTAVPIKEWDWFYKDVDTGEILIHHKAYWAYGGWVMRYTPLSMGWPRPMLFEGSCAHDYSVRNNVFSINDITYIN